MTTSSTPTPEALATFSVLVSGGKDSLSCAAWLDEHRQLARCVSLDTRIAVPGWLEFVRDTCASRGWPLEVYTTPVDYDDLVRKYGFPGPAKHWVMVAALKGRGVRQFKKAHPGEMLASGVRKSESARRLRTVSEWSTLEGVKVYNPLWKWSEEQTWAYFRAQGFERAPAYSTLGISGDCLCGAYARPDEKELIRLSYPAVYARLIRLEGEAVRHAEKSQWGWAASYKRRKGAPSPACVECVR
jgi:3'-phosphoadenosine 5'-phosphosulfate sulfotransferase (PAPS reductase)/FAD synthetase